MLVGESPFSVTSLDERSSRLINLACHASPRVVAVAPPGETMSFERVPGWVERLRQPDPIV
ncbi:MAG: hypothetical protein HC794_06270, partial [Nitrospiraceae bacterium]|nr:hypothetical protein [Nitrospiraceae bacterium]